jgi:type II restriction/modification system DNA methylase subunit YeeA
MNITQIEKNLKNLIDSFDKDEFIYDLLLAYGRPKSSIAKLKVGNLNLSKVEGEVSWKKQLFFKEENNADLHLTISELVKTIKNDQRFVIVTDYETLLAVDTKTLDKLDIKLTDLPKHYDFFLPWAGMEKAQHQDENPADVKAAEKMAKLFDKIKEDNPDDSPEFLHGLNVFLSRLLFCFFAEDTNIFTENQFTSNISSHTQPDGSDLHNYLASLFKVLNTPESDRQGLPDYLKEFPYVNGELFSKEHQIPIFKTKSRQAIIDSGTLDWSSINPDIFGSMFQAVVGETERGSLGMHYTSVPNIMKVIKPLFLDDLYEAFDKSIGNNKKLIKLADRLSKIKIFDPACGSGNFLIIAFKELKRLEMEIFKELNSFTFSQITPSQFYGIEIDDFAHEIAKLSLWLTEHQMNVEFNNEFGKANPTLPLKKAGNITCANATRIDWESVCPKEQDDEIYVLGNPPYLGYSLQDKDQKSDIECVFSPITDRYKELDYISCWFYISSNYIKNSSAKSAFVSTNSICQGEQVGMIWPYIFDKDVEINFAHHSFKWTNNAKSNAQVIVVIIGLSNKSNNAKYIFKEYRTRVKNINAYLVDASNTIVISRSKPLSDLPKMTLGSMAKDDGNFFMNKEEKDDLLINHPSSKQFIKQTLGSSEFIRGDEKYCLWIDDKHLHAAMAIPPIKERLNNISVFRKKSKAKSTADYAKYPNRFKQRTHKNTASVIVPRVSSERRKYVPSGFLNNDIVVKDSAFAIYNATPVIFSIISSKMHMVWMRMVAGRLKTDYRYSSALVYNTFSFPNISEKQKEELTQNALNIVSEREKNPERTLAQLYDPDKMPDGLREAHHQNDLAIERCYRSKPFENDEERLEYLFKLYEKMIAEEEAK